MLYHKFFYLYIMQPSIHLLIIKDPINVLFKGQKSLNQIILNYLLALQINSSIWLKQNDLLKIF